MKAAENEGIMKSIADENHLRMPSMDVERTQTQMQVSTSRKRKVKGPGAQQRDYRCGKPRIGEHQVKRRAPNSAEFCSGPKERRYDVKWVVLDGWNVGYLLGLNFAASIHLSTIPSSNDTLRKVFSSNTNTLAQS